MRCCTVVYEYRNPTYKRLSLLMADSIMLRLWYVCAEEFAHEISEESFVNVFLYRNDCPDPLFFEKLIELVDVKSLIGYHNGYYGCEFFHCFLGKKT